MKHFVISLKNADERRQHILNQFKKNQTDFTFFDAVTPINNDKTAKNLGLNINNANLSTIEISCLLSHMSLWQYAINNELPYIFIYEDDIYLGDEAYFYLNDNQWLKQLNFDVIKLEAFLEKTHLIPTRFNQLFPKNLTIPRYLYRLKSNHMGAAGYVLSFNGAKKALEFAKNMSTDELVAVDHILFEKMLNTHLIYQISPAICIQSMFYETAGFQSQIEDSRKTFNYKKNFNYTIKEKITAIQKRFKKSVGKRIYYQFVDFK